MNDLFNPLTQFFTQNDFQMLKLLSIPVISAFSGWITNWIGIKLTLYPTNFVGIKPCFGWQGILPAKSEKMARILMAKTLEHLGSLTEIFREMEPEKISQYMQTELTKNVDIYVSDTMEELMPVAWANTPNILKERLYKRIVKQAPEIADGILDDISNNVDKLVSLENMVVDQLGQDPALLVRIFKEIGEREMNFGVNSGFFFGLILGTIQMLFWAQWELPWILPLFGVMVGTVTNWIVLNIIFRPLNPVQILPSLNLGIAKTKPIILHGLFLKRQDAVATVFSRILTTELITMSRFMDTVLNGEQGGRARKIIKRRVRPYLESVLAKLALVPTVGFERYMEIKNELQDKAIALSAETLDDPIFNAERGAVIQKFFCAKIKAMPSSDYQDMIRPAFKEDEWILLLLGGVLGGLVGFAQFVHMFAS